MTDLLIDLDEARKMHAVGTAAIANALAAEKRMIDEAVRGRVALPEHYWQPRVAMQRKHHALGELIKALEECS